MSTRTILITAAIALAAIAIASRVAPVKAIVFGAPVA